MKKMSSRTSVRYASALASRRPPRSRTCQPSSYVVATTYELGWHVRERGGRLDASADAYRTDVRDDIFFIASTVTGGYFQNISATRRSGVELAVQWLGPAGLRAYANYGYTRATFETTATLATTRDPAGETVTPGDELPMVPGHRVNAGLTAPILRPHA